MVHSVPVPVPARDDATQPATVGQADEDIALQELRAPTCTHRCGRPIGTLASHSPLGARKPGSQQSQLPIRERRRHARFGAAAGH